MSDYEIEHVGEIQYDDCGFVRPRALYECGLCGALTTHPMPHRQWHKVYTPEPRPAVSAEGTQP